MGWRVTGWGVQGVDAGGRRVGAVGCRRCGVRDAEGLWVGTGCGVSGAVVWGNGVWGAAGLGYRGGCGLSPVPLTIPPPPPGFTRALGSALSDSCSGEPLPGQVPGPVPGGSRTARRLQQLYPGLGLALRCLRALPGEWGREGGTGGVPPG